MALFDCTCDAVSGHARALTYTTARGDFHTPKFMPVGTSATVKGITTDQLRELGSQVVLANTYHLAMRPGAELVAEAGGIHRFMNYDGPMLTDSGGFQVFSLADTVKLSDDGVTFQSIYDGSKIHWTPEENMRIQELIGADIAMQLDQCAPYPATREFVARAVDYSSAWARRCLAAHTRPDQTLFGIVQGGMHLDLRLESVRRLREIEEESLAAGGRRFGGYGIGGDSGGEDHGVMSRPWERWPAPARTTGRATSWAWATPPRSCARCARASTCSTACCPPARPAWARRSPAPAA